MFIINWRLALIVLASSRSFWWSLRVSQAHPGQFRNVRKLNSKITGAYNENITGVRVVKALGREKEICASLAS
jgi:ATP-binding cassette, subfamily B, bacterial